MKELLVRNGNPNFRFIAALFIGDSIVRIFNLLNYYKVLSMSSTPVGNLLYAEFLLQFVLSFFAFWIWAYALTRINTENIAAKIFIPAICIGVMYAIRLVIMNYVKPPSSPTSIYYYISPFLGFVVIIGLCELLYKHFQHKLVLYALAGVATTLMYQLISFVRFEEMSFRFSVTFFMQGAIGEILQVFFAAFFLTLLKEEYVFPINSAGLRKIELQNRIQHGLSNFIPRQDIFNQLKMEFSDVSDKFIARSIVQSIDQEDRNHARLSNAFLIFMVIASAASNFYMYVFAKNDMSLSGFDLYFLAQVLVSLGLPILICIKLKLAIDMLKFKPYAYSSLIILSILGIIAVIIEGIWGKWRFEFSIEFVIKLVGNLLVLWIASTVRRHLFPYYSLFSTKRNEEGGYAV